MKTTDQILQAIRQERPMSRMSLYRHLKELNLQPLGIRQRPQRYPENAAALILERLGIVPTSESTAIPTRPKANRKGGRK